MEVRKDDLSRAYRAVGAVAECGQSERNDAHS